MTTKEKLLINEILLNRIKYINNQKDKINSIHEGYAILKEELEETNFEIDRFKISFNEYWLNCKKDLYINENINNMIEFIFNLIDESIDILTVLNRIKEIE